MNTIFDIDIPFGDLRIPRLVTFDGDTFSSLQDIKRLLNEHHNEPLTNSEVIRAIILSHPQVQL